MANFTAVMVYVGLSSEGLKKWSMQAMLSFAAKNLKKLANWTW
ncbi:hypothetical protein [Lysinibacillus sp. UGB7]